MRHAAAIGPALERQRAIGTDEGAEGVGRGLDLAATALHAAPAVGHRQAAPRLECREDRDQLVEHTVVDRRRRRVAGEGVVLGGGVGDELEVREPLGRIGGRAGQLRGQLVLAETQHAPGDEIDGLDGLLQHGRATGVPGAGVLCFREVPEPGVVRVLAVDLITAATPRQVERVDAAPGTDGGAAGQERCTRGVVHDRTERRVRTDAQRHNGGERRAARVRRHAAVRLEGVDEVALVAAQLAVIAHRHRGHDVPAVLVDITDAARGRAAVDGAAAQFGDVGETAEVKPLEIILEDEVDDAADGIGAVDRRRAVLEHFDALDGGHGDLVDVDRAAVEAVGRDSSTVQQHEGRRRALTAKVGGGRAVVAALGAEDHIRVACEIVEAVAVADEIADELLRAVDALATQVFGGDDLQRHGAVRDLPTDAGPRDDHGLELADVPVSGSGGLLRRSARHSSQEQYGKPGAQGATADGTGRGHGVSPCESRRKTESVAAACQEAAIRPPPARACAASHGRRRSRPRRPRAR